MTHEDMNTLMQTYFDAICAADADRLRSLFVSDICWRIPKGAIEPYGGSHVGAEKIIDMMLSAVGQSFVEGSQHFQIHTRLFGDNVACAETEMTARSPDGRDYRNDYTFFFEFRDERISEVREHVDTRYAADFFG